MTAFSQVRGRVETNISSFEESGKNVFDALPLSTAWISTDLAAYHDGRRSLVLLEGAKWALLESASSWGLGFSRGAASSLRTYIENMFSWLYYKDHPIEYSLVEKRVSDLMLPKGVQGYLKEIDTGFDMAYKFLLHSKVRTSDYFYTDLSYYIHAHPSQIVVSKDLSELVVSVPPEVTFIQICQYVDEFISDNFLVYYRHSWGGVPLQAQANAEGRLGNKLPKFIAVS